MTSYDDIIADATGIIYQGKYDHNASKANDKLAGFKLWNFALKATPKGGVSLAHNVTKEEKWDDKKDAAVVADKSATKIGYKHGDLKFDEAFANDKWSFKVESPLAKDDWKVDGSLAFERKPAKEMKLNVDASIESPDMSGTTAVINVGFEQKMPFDADKKAWGSGDNKIALSAGFQYEKDILFGFAVEHDTKDLTDAEVTACYKDGKQKYWGGYDHGNKFVKAGCKQFWGEKNFTHAYEARWNLKEDAPGRLMGQPLTVAAGGKYVLSESSTMGYMLELGAKAHMIGKYEHKLDRNWKLTGTQSFDGNLVGTKQAPYKAGFDVTYTI